MFEFTRFSALALTCVLSLFVISGCGSGASTTPIEATSLDTSLSNAQGIELSTKSLVFISDYYNNSPPAKSVTAFVNADVNSISVAIYGDTVTDNWLSIGNKPTVDGGTANLELSVSRHNSLSTGLYDATLRVIARDVNDNPIAYRDIHVKYVKTTTVNNFSTLNFQSTIGDTDSPAAQLVNMQLKGDEEFIILYAQGKVENWLAANFSKDRSKLSVAVTPNGLTEGIYSANIYIVPRGQDRATLLVSVFYNVKIYTPPPPPPVILPSIQIYPMSLAFSVGLDTVDADLTKSVVVSGPGTWTASTTASWISLPKDSGSSGDSLDIKIIPSEAFKDYWFANYGDTLYSSVYFAFKTSTSGTINASLSVSLKKGPLPQNFVTPTSLNFNVGIDSTTSDVSKTVTMGTSGTAKWTASSNANWIKLSSASGNVKDTLTVSLVPDVVKTLQNYYYSNTGWMTISFTTTHGYTYNTNVSLSVAFNSLPSNFITPGALQFDLNSTTVVADLTKSVKTGTGASTWTATNNAPWVSLSSIKGIAGDNIGVSIVPTEIAKLDTATATASISFIFTNVLGMTYPFNTTVTMNNTLPKIVSVTPYVALTGVAGQKAIVRGTGFARDTVPTFGGTAATNTTFVSSTELQVTLPTFSADGTYLATAQTMPTGLAALQTAVNVVATQETAPSAAQSLIYPNSVKKSPLRVIYDAERHAILVGISYPPSIAKPATFGEILRYIESNGTWLLDNAANSVTFANLSDLALSPDGQTVVAVSATEMTAYNPVTLAAGKSRTLGGSGYGSVVVTNDGQALVYTSGSGYTSPWGLNKYPLNDWKANSTSIASGYYYNSSTLLEPYRLGISLDGSRAAYISLEYQTYNSLYIKQYSASSGLISNWVISGSLPATGFVPQLDRHATKMVLANSSQYTVYDSTDISVPKSAGVLGVSSGNLAIISPNGNRFYTCCTYTTSGTVTTATLHTYDISTFSAANGYSEIGTGTDLPKDPGNGGTTGVGVKFAISYDGKTLFIAGDNALIVMPAP